MKSKTIHTLAYIVIGLVVILLFLLNRLINSHIIQIMIAIGALGTAYYARRSFEKTNQMFEEERLSKKGQLATGKNPGGLFDNNKKLKIHFNNYGINTITDVIVNVLMYEKNSKFETGKEQIPVVNQIAYAGNLLPRSVNLEIIIDFLTALPNPGKTPYYIIARVEYFDVMLERTFDNQYFFWQLGGRNLLDEIEFKDRKRIKDILKFDKEFWTFISKDFKKRQ